MSGQFQATGPDAARGEPLVSVIIPSYNSASHIDATLESVLAQSWRNIEVIVVDDGSTDDSVDHIRRFESRGVQLILQRNSGAAAARNRAFLASSGTFVQFLDADDLISPHKIEHQLERLFSQPRGVASCAWGRFTRDISDYKPNPEPVWRDLPALDWLALSREDGLGMMFPATWLIPRSLVEAAGPWDESLSLNDDTEYFTRLLTKSERVLFSQQAIAYYRSGVSGSLSGQKTDKAWRSAFKVHELCEAHLLGAEKSERMQRAASLSWQQFAFACYPYQAKLGDEALRRAKRLSAAQIKMPEEGVFGLVSALVGWKMARRLPGLEAIDLKILLTADPELPVPPKLYGGIERVIHLLADGLVDRGHDVTLIAHKDSGTRAKLVSYSDADWRSVGGTLAHMALVTKTVLSGGFDMVHSHSRIAYLTPVLPMSVPKLMSYQRQVTPSSITWARRLAGDSIEFSAVSHAMIADVASLAPWHVVYNGVPLETYDLRETVAQDAPLVFLGRIEPIKGAHIAIEVARRTGVRLVIAGNIPDEHRGYFDAQVAPHLDGERIAYIGPVDDRQKNEMLGSARAFLMPILWEEPFGIVMAEALACGTPVIGLARGSVPEVVEHGVSGFVCDDVEALVGAVSKIPLLDRRACRRRAATMFSETIVVDKFVEVYSSLQSFSQRLK